MRLEVELGRIGRNPPVPVPLDELPRLARLCGRRDDEEARELLRPPLLPFLVERRLGLLIGKISDFFGIRGWGLGIRETLNGE